MAKWDEHRWDICARLLEPMNSDLRVAEIGVFRGRMAKRLLGMLGERVSEYYMVDPWGYQKGYVDGVANFMKDKDQWERMYRKALKMTRRFKDQRRVLRMPSVEASKRVADAHLDLVYIDANHMYEFVKQDIMAWLPKVRGGGYIAGHDYDNPVEPKWGVRRAVDELLGSYGDGVQVGKDYTWWVCV